MTLWMSGKALGFDKSFQSVLESHALPLRHAS
jgi:hypothetical protein